MMVGGYGLAITVDTLGLSMWLGIPIGLLAAAVLAVVLGGPTLRLRADYFAITTIAAGEILRLVIRSQPVEPFTGGVFGLQGIAGDFYAVNPIPNGRYGWVSSVLRRAAVGHDRDLGPRRARQPADRRTRAQPWGRVIKSIREDEDAARSPGKNVVAFKMQSLVIGGVIGGAAGIMAVLRLGRQFRQLRDRDHVLRLHDPDPRRGGHEVGPVIGAAIFWFLNAGLDAFLREAQDRDLLPRFLAGSDAVGAVTLFAVGLGLTLLASSAPRASSAAGRRWSSMPDVATVVAELREVEPRPGVGSPTPSSEPTASSGASAA